MQVLALMRDSHVLVNVSHIESFGMVFLEGMSQGMLCLGPDWEVQREIFDEGRAGMNMRCEVGTLACRIITGDRRRGVSNRARIGWMAPLQRKICSSSGGIQIC